MRKTFIQISGLKTRKNGRNPRVAFKDRSGTNINLSYTGDDSLKQEYIL